jgi:predicted negative regulator of RcsB-dependent stress response
MNADFISLQARAWVLQDSNLDDAYNSAMLLIKNNTSDVFAWDILGQVVAKRESVDSALEIIETVVSKGAQLSMIYEHLGDMYAIQGDKERALRSYHQALDLSEDCMIVVPVVKKKIRKIK